MIQFFRKLFSDPEVKLVASIEANYKMIDRINKTEKKCSVTYYLFEDEKGKRSMSATDSEEGEVDLDNVTSSSWVHRSEEYRNQIKPWLCGRYDPEIPSFSQVDIEDFKVALKGKK